MRYNVRPSSAVMSVQPLAPRHPREDLHRFVNGLNVHYGIGIPIPDPALSPSKRKEQGSTSTRLYTRLEVHFYHGGIEALHALTDVFDAEAKDHWSKWVRKPNGDLGTLPRTGNTPWAANNTERQWLQSIFHQVLDSSQPTRFFGRTQSGPAAYSIEKTTNQPKRGADADMRRTPTKRAKPGEQHASAALSSATRLFATPKPASMQSRCSSVRTAESLNKSFQSLKSETTMGSSINTSKASFASVFSNQHPGPYQTQDTTEVSTQELPVTRTDPSFQEIYPPTSDDKEALYSLDNCGKSIPKEEIQDALQEKIPSPAQTSNISSPESSAIAAAIRDPKVEVQPKLAEQRQCHWPSNAETSEELIQPRLRFVLRMCCFGVGHVL